MMFVSGSTSNGSGWPLHPPEQRSDPCRRCVDEHAARGPSSEIRRAAVGKSRLGGLDARLFALGFARAHHGLPISFSRYG